MKMKAKRSEVLVFDVRCSMFDVLPPRGRELVVAWNGVRWRRRGIGAAGAGLEGLAEGGEAGEVRSRRTDGGEGGAEQVVEVIGDFLRLADGVGGDGDAAAGVGLDDIDGVVALEEGETVPEEGFGGRRGRWRRGFFRCIRRRRGGPFRAGCDRRGCGLSRCCAWPSARRPSGASRNVFSTRRSHFRG